MYTVYDDNVLDDISLKEIQEEISEEEIFEYLFGFYPVPNQKVTSIFREDNNPGAWFEYTENGLRFIDFADHRIIDGIKMWNIGCYDAVKVLYSLSSFRETLHFIRENIVPKNEISPKFKVKKLEIQKYKSHSNVKILIQPKLFSFEDELYWKKYGISKEQLLNDKVFSISSFKMLNTRGGDFEVKNTGLAFAYTNFDKGRKKIYRPYQVKNNKFNSNCTENDIGEVDFLPSSDELLIISKSYKDCRVLRNFNFNSIWFQNEGMIPKAEYIIPILKRFDKVIVFFDNDEPGVRAADVVVKTLNSHFPQKSSSFYIPEKFKVKDPAEFYQQYGENKLKKLLKNI